MKVLTFKRLMGLAIIGGVAYAHKQRGGQWTVASVADTVRHLWSSSAGRLFRARVRAANISQQREAHVQERSARGRSASEYRPATYGDVGKRED